MPTLVPDRVPTFDPASQCWHWWSTPGQPSSFRQDQAQAEAIEAVWRLIDPEAGTWSCIVQPLPGFAPFLWNISAGHLWLRRPEGVWKTSLPTLRRKNTVILQEICPSMGGPGLRKPIECDPATSISNWHSPRSNVVVNLVEWDRKSLGETIVVDGLPMLINHVQQRMLPDVKPRHALLIPLWSRPGASRFAQKRLTINNVEQSALVITLPNGLSVVHPFGQVIDDLNLDQSQFAIVIGDVDWHPWYVQPVIIDENVGER